ncbi:terpene synthase family protein [Chitinophaga sp. RAB17]|uniref:terpene synthase family protein n=1 Tax=Chitinophaga sp. RAB17 TaxID=3233049 RepID=UPI003F9074D6
MSMNAYACTLPGQPAINAFFEEVQLNTLKWAQRFDLAPQFKSIGWYTKARFGLQAAREYPNATYNQICLAGDLLTWLFTVDDTCDRGSAGAEAAVEMKSMLHEFIEILENKREPSDNSLSIGLANILERFRATSTPYLYRQYCKHMIDYLKECFFEIDMQLHSYVPSIAKYFEMRPFTGFYIMFPLVAIFEKLDLPDEVYEHETIVEIELILNLLGCLANDLHSIAREKDLEIAGFNLIFIAQRELNLPHEEAVQYVIDYHDEYLFKLEQLRKEIPYWNESINTQLDEYIQGLYTIVKGYDDWAILDTGRYESI